MAKRFEIEPDRGFVVVRLAPALNHRLRTEDEAELRQLVRDNELVVFDFSSTTRANTTWIRFVHALTIDARDMGKDVVVAGMIDALLDKADLIAVKQDLRLEPTVEGIAR